MLMPFVLFAWGAGFLTGALSGTLVGSLKQTWLKQTPRNALIAASGVGGMLAAVGSGQATGTLLDPVLRFALAALLVAAIGKVRRWVRACAAVCIALPAIAVAAGWVDGRVDSRLVLGIGTATAAAAVSSFLFPERIAWFGTLIGIGVSFTALRLPTSLPSLMPSALVAVVTAAVCALAWGSLKKPTRSRFRRGAFVVGGVGFIGVAAGVIALTNARASAERGLNDARNGLTAAANGDVTAAQESFASSSKSLKRANDQLSSPYARISQIVPILSQHVTVLQDLTGTAATLTKTANIAAGQADLEQLRVDGGAIDLQKMIKLRAELDATDAAIIDAKNALQRSNSPWLVPQLSSRISSFDSQIATAEKSSDQVRQILNVVPAMLGESGPRRYLLLLPTPAEARGSGGVIGNWGELTADNGRLTLSRFGRSRDLYNLGTPEPWRSTSVPPDYVARYGPFAAPYVWSNATMSPDFPTVARAIAEQYAQAVGSPVDGVISVDPIALQALLGALGPLEVPSWDVPLTSTNTAAILLHDAYVVKGGGTEERIGLLEDVTRGVWTKLVAGAAPNPQTLVSALAPSVASRHLQLWMNNPQEQAYLGSLRATGSVPLLAGDSLGVIVNNQGENKIDYYVRRSIRTEVVLDPATNMVRTKVQMTLTNTLPAEEQTPYVIGSGYFSPVGSARMYVSVYSSLAAQSADVDGAIVPMESQREFGRNVHSVWTAVPRGESQTITFELAGANPSNPGSYRVDLFTQPLVNPDDVSVAIRTTGARTLAAVSGVSGSGNQVSARLQPKATETFEVQFSD
jgi:hypothetical protein